MNLFDICAGMEWNANGKFEFHPGSAQYNLLAEYLSIFKNATDLSIEYKKLIAFQEKLHNSTKLPEQFIQDELWGFIEIEGRIYAFIGGSMDFRVRLLFDPEKRQTWIQPIYSSIDWFAIDLKDLTHLLDKVITVINCLY